MKCIKQFAAVYNFIITIKGRAINNNLANLHLTILLNTQNKMYDYTRQNGMHLLTYISKLYNFHQVSRVFAEIQFLSLRFQQTPQIPNCPPLMVNPL